MRHDRSICSCDIEIGSLDSDLSLGPMIGLSTAPK